MRTLLIVGCGGFLGASLRYLVALLLFNASARFPWATLSVNVLGCLLIGFCSAAIQAKLLSPGWALFLMTGLLGGFTTFSAFGLETVTLLNSGRSTTAATYVILSLVAGIAALWLAQSFATNQ